MADGIAGLGADLLNVSGGVVERSSFYENGANSPAPGHNGLMVEYSDHVVIRLNEAYRNHDGIEAATGQRWGDGQGIVANGLIDCVVEHNYTHENDNSGIEVIGEYADSHRLTVRYNISENDVSGIILGWVRVWDLTVHNNTIYVSQAPGEFRVCITVMAWSGSAAFYNNLFVADGGAVHVQVTSDSLEEGDTLRFAGNVYHAPRSAHPLHVLWGEEGISSLAAWRSGWGQEVLDGQATGLEADPLLVAPGTGGTVGDPGLLESITGYQLQPGSPAAAAGEDLRPLGIDPGPRDFYGNPVAPGAARSVGAHELPAVPDAFVVAALESGRSR